MEKLNQASNPKEAAPLDMTTGVDFNNILSGIGADGAKFDQFFFGKEADKVEGLSDEDQVAEEMGSTKEAAKKRYDDIQERARQVAFMASTKPMKGNLVVNESQSDSDHAPISAIVDIPSEEEVKAQQVEEKKSDKEAFI